MPRRTNVRWLFAAVLVFTLVCLVTPGESVLVVKLWLSSWVPFAHQLDAANVSQHADKWVHAGLFAALGFLAIKGWMQRHQRMALALGLVSLAPHTEWVQAHIPGRGASGADVLADWLGLSVGLAWGWWLQRQRSGAST